MSKKRLIITSIISIVCVAILLIGSTYSIFTTSEIDETANIYKTGVLDVTYTLSSSNVQLTDITPRSAGEGDAVYPFRITVTNNGTVPYQFDVILNDTTASNTIDYQYIMTKVGYLEAKLLSDCTDNIIKEDVVVLPNTSVDIDVRVWIADTVQNSEIGKSFYAKLAIDGLAVYNDETEIDNSNLALIYMNGFSGSWDTSYFHNSTYLQKIKNVSFVDYIDTSDVVKYWDMSVDGDNSVIAWVVDNETEGYYDLYIGANQVIYAKNLSHFFRSMKAVDSISFDNLNTALATNMLSMFSGTGENSTVFTLDLGEKFDTSNVTDMSAMFDYTGYSSTIFTLDLGEKFDTSNVTDMSSMFSSTGFNSTVFTLDLGGKFDTSNVTNMSYMFSGTGYRSTTFTLDLGEKFNTSNVTNMSYMFYNTGGSSTVFTLDLGEKLDTSNVTNMYMMFYYTGYSSTVFTLDLGEKFDTSNVTNMSSMFNYTGYANTSLVLDLTTFTFDNVTTYTKMFTVKATTTIKVKSTADQTWILDKGFSNLSTTNVIVV